MAFSRKNPPSAKQACPLANPCQEKADDDHALVSATAERIKNLTGSDVITEGKLPLDDQNGGPMMMSTDVSACKQQAFRLDVTIRRFNRFRQALPYARSASDLNALGDASDSPEKRQKRAKKCLTLLSGSAKELNAALGLPQGTIKDADLRNDKTGFRAALYRNESNGKLILVPRDTQPDSLVDWKTNTDNGQGKDTDQYMAMRELSYTLYKKDVAFDIAGYSKGGGLAQEGGLMSPKSNVIVFNSAGLHDASLARTGNSSFDSLTSRTQSFSAEGDFLTYMNETTNPDKQITNARFLRTELAGEGRGVNPMNIKHRNPEMKAADKKTHFWQDDPDPAFDEDKQKYLQQLDAMIARAEDDRKANRPFRLFPPVQVKQHETVPDSMSAPGKMFGARKDKPNLGRLAQHQMNNVLDPMEQSVNNDRQVLQDFLEKCGG